uniref:Uncharacterized protein n=1 Tax=Utricularia reniformis TaxID=192314 RepID=A0A1Y0B1N6_9LAMI|nr:hypothetical protein AEK19_MT1072 [Utricularia reniformis]ART31294.1 hypothetical protein AEK19_MT1072 [Utricularia reniformis]
MGEEGNYFVIRWTSSVDICPSKSLSSKSFFPSVDDISLLSVCGSWTFSKSPEGSKLLSSGELI